LDDGISFQYKKGNFQYRNLQFSHDKMQKLAYLGNTLISGCPTYTHLKSELPVSPISGKVEKIVVCGLSSSVSIKKVKVSDDSADLEFFQEKGIVSVRAPNVNIDENWNISFYM
jgi:hypothetical protein